VFTLPDIILETWRACRGQDTVHAEQGAENGTDLHKADKAEVAEQQVEELRPRKHFQIAVFDESCM